MFAPWIPEVLEQIAALEDVPDPPHLMTIQEARCAVVNRSGHEAPNVAAFKSSRGVGIEIKWSYLIIRNYGDGELITYVDVNSEQPEESRMTTSDFPPHT